MSTTPIHSALRARVAELAGYRCGYCLTAEEVVGSPMEINHLMPEARGGLTIEDKLWLACSVCNTYKGDKTTGLDPFFGEIVPLFNPRLQSWQEHFTWTTGHDYMIRSHGDRTRHRHAPISASAIAQPCRSGRRSLPGAVHQIARRHAGGQVGDGSPARSGTLQPKRLARAEIEERIPLAANHHLVYAAIGLCWLKSRSRRRHAARA